MTASRWLLHAADATVPFRVPDYVDQDSTGSIGYASIRCGKDLIVTDVYPILLPGESEAGAMIELLGSAAANTEA